MLTGFIRICDLITLFAIWTVWLNICSALVFEHYGMELSRSFSVIRLIDERIFFFAPMNFICYNEIPKLRVHFGNIEVIRSCIVPLLGLLSRILLLFRGYYIRCPAPSRERTRSSQDEQTQGPSTSGICRAIDGTPGLLYTIWEHFWHL